ncbi:MAG: MarR family transcriptional regulator [Ruminococcus sp.]|nr:MarR family transcriptional regulator [Ruminococcus sp.]
MKKQYFEILAKSDFATTYHYKIVLLLLATGALTQAQLADELNMKRQNVNRYVKDLLEHGYVTVERIEGRNKFLKVVTSIKDIRSTNSDEVISGQLEF